MHFSFCTIQDDDYYISVDAKKKIHSCDMLTHCAQVANIINIFCILLLQICIKALVLVVETELGDLRGFLAGGGRVRPR